MAQIDSLTQVGLINATDLALIIRAGGNVLATVGTMAAQGSGAVDINGGAIDGTPIGANTPAYITGTRVIASEGITLGNGTTYAAANTLDDYEEGSWTPSLSDGTTTGTSCLALATYVKVGRLVTLHGRIIISSKGSLSGSLLVASFPFTSASSAGRFGSLSVVQCEAANITAGENISGFVPASSTSAALQVYNAGTGTAALDTAEVTADFGIIFICTYETDA